MEHLTVPWSLKVSILSQCPYSLIPIRNQSLFQDLLGKVFEDLGARAPSTCLKVFRKCSPSNGLHVLHFLVRHILGLNRPQCSTLDLVDPPIQLIPLIPLVEEEEKTLKLINLRAKKSTQRSTLFERILASQALGLDRITKDLRSKYQLSPAARLFFQNHLPQVFPAYNVEDRSLLTVESLTSNPQISENMTRVNGHTLLHQAASEGGIEVLKVLIAAGASIEATDANGWTPMHHAAQQGQEGAIRLLKESGANIEAASNNGWTPLHYAAQQGQEGAIRLLIDLGANIEAASNNGWTPMHIAAQEGQEGAIRLLKESGANIEAADNDNGWTPMHYAALLQGREGAIGLLTELGANIEATDDNGRTPMHLAAQQGQEGAIRLLIDLGANIEAADNDGWTPMHLAAQQGQEGAIRLLIELGANIEVADADGWTPMHHAAWDGHTEVIRALHGLGENLNKLSKGLATPWDLSDNRNAQKVLEECGAIPSLGKVARISCLFGLGIGAISALMLFHEEIVKINRIFGLKALPYFPNRLLSEKAPWIWKGAIVGEMTGLATAAIFRFESGRDLFSSSYIWGARFVRYFRGRGEQI